MSYASFQEIKTEPPRGGSVLYNVLASFTGPSFVNTDGTFSRHIQLDIFIKNHLP